VFARFPAGYKLPESGASIDAAVRERRRWRRAWAARARALSSASS
jgi:hypothetical protein